MKKDKKKNRQNAEEDKCLKCDKMVTKKVNCKENICQC